MRYNKKIKQSLVILVSLVGAIYAGFPIFWMLISSFKPNTEIFSYPPKIFSSNDSLSSYLNILTDPAKVRFFLNSYLIGMTVTILTLLVSLLAAYSFSRFEFKGKKVINTIIISIQAIPPITLLIPYFGLIVALRLFNTYAALILTYVVTSLPYAILMMTGYFNTLPRELDEAALIDGASHTYMLWRILIPISLPGIISVSMYTFMQCWNEFLFALTLTKTIEKRTVPIGIQLLMGQHSYDWNEMMAMSILGCLPILVLFLFFQNFFIQGMTSGAVKS